MFDTETSGVFSKKMTELDPRAPHMASLAVLGFTDDLQTEVFSFYKLIRPDGWVMPEEASKVNGLTHEQLEREGIPLVQAFLETEEIFMTSNVVAGFNVSFDFRILHTECLRLKRDHPIDRQKTRCLMLAMADVIREPTAWGDFAWPKLTKAFKYCYGVDFEGAHDALSDVRATRDVWAMCRHKGWVDF